MTTSGSFQFGFTNYRVSTDKQGLQGNGIEAQKRAVARYLASMDCELVGSFEEVESGANNKRPQLTAAIQLAKSKKAVLVIAKLDRLSRNAAFLLQLQDSGIDFIACGVVLGNPHPEKSLRKAVEANIKRKQEFAATALKSIREIQSTGVETLSRIADCMNKRGEKTPRGGTWTATAVKRVLECAA